MPTAAGIRARWPDAFPATWDVGNVVLDAAIAEASRRIAQPLVLGAKYEDAAGYLAAHLAYVNFYLGSSSAGGVPTAGPVTSMSVGSVSVGYGAGAGAAMSETTSDLASTEFGRLYLGLIHNVTRFRMPWDT